MRLASPRRGYRALQAATIRDFSGGLNTVDTELNIQSRFAVRGDNVFFNADGSVELRQGVERFVDCRPHMTSQASIVNMVNYNNALVVVASNGNVLVVLPNRTVFRIWDDSFASRLPGSPNGWGPTTFASFAAFNNLLTIHNGTDKPLVVNPSFAVDYLKDPATGTNINTPVCRYSTVVGRYLVLAGDLLNSTTIYISARDAPGVYFGDTGPNDAVKIDVGSLLPTDTNITGLATFRGNLLVLASRSILIGRLGEYDSNNNHIPQFDDAIEDFGCISHRLAVTVGDDAFVADMNGISSIRRTVLSLSLKPEHINDVIRPETNNAFAKLAETTIEDKTFAVHDSKEGRLMVFIPNHDEPTETVGYAYTYRPARKHASWSRIKGWNWTCGCKTFRGNIFFANAQGNIYLMGSKDRPIYADFVDPTTVYEGAPISFVWETPWFDMGNRRDVKLSRYLSMDTEGSASFLVEMFVNRIDQPYLSMQFEAHDTPFYGGGSQPYGGGRNTAYEKLIAWNANFTMAKFRFSGNATEKWKFASLTLHYMMGKNRL